MQALPPPNASRYFNVKDFECDACTRKQQKGRGDNDHSLGGNVVVSTLRPKQKFDL